MHDDRPTVQRQLRIESTMTSSMDEDVTLNLPHAMDENSITNSNDRVAAGAEELKLPILRTEAGESLNSAVQPQSNYILMGSTEQRVEPQREILHAAESLDVSHHADGRPAPQKEVVLRNSLTQVEVIPTDVVPIIITTTVTSAPTTVPTVLSTSSSISHEPLATEIVHNVDETSLLAKVEEKTRDYKAASDELPTAKTFALDEVKPVLPSSTKDNLFAEKSKEKSVSVDETKSEPTAGPHSDLRSKEEDEDAEPLPEFDEKTDVELEFHDDDVGTTPSDEILPTTTESTSSIPPQTTSASIPTTLPVDSAEKDFFSEEEIYDIIMFLVKLLPEVEERSTWSKIIAGLQCALRDCRRAFPRLTTIQTPVGNGTFIIRRARSECLCSIMKSQENKNS
ncbi:hypothetical protein RB195_016684 [Necator americanus]